jgi:hypothetical protein
MTVPGKVKIGGQSWRVKVGPIHTDDGDYLYGRTVPRRLLIQVAADQAAAQARDTMLHEILHAVVSNTALGMSDADEEQLIRTVTPWLLAVLRDNPDLTGFLTT